MLSGRTIALVEDDEIMGASLQQRLVLEGAEVAWLRTVARALPAIRTPRRPFDAVVCDIRLPDGTGEALFLTLLRTSSPPPFLFITGQGEIAQAVRMLRSGAADYIAKPFEMRAFLERLAVVAQPRTIPDLPAQSGISAAARAVDRQAAAAARSDAPLLIRGLPGLGKARIARRIHDLSDRRAAPFVLRDAMRALLDAPALRAAETEVGEGSLVLLGVGRMTADAQDALMAMLRDGPARILATAGLGLEARVAAGVFRADLMDVLRSREIVVPPLSERAEDAVWLAGQLFTRLNAGRRNGLSSAAEETIRAHDWPGNGRELRARLARAIEAAEGPLILPADLFPERAGLAGWRPLADVRDAAERAHIAATLDATGGHVAEAARLLGIARTTLWEKMQKLGL
ncbi:MAG: sigma-54-dependent transcriptional regulator [Gemmobacter sp.]